MKKQLFVILATILSLISYAQRSYEKGYYINNSNERVDCLIENGGWKYNPSEFEYTLTENSDKKIATITSVKEFGIYNTCKYTRQLVKIDISSDELGELSKVIEPIFKEEELFLKVLVEGKANLYEYRGPNSTRYFYNKDNSEIAQLIFKKYLTKGTKFAENSWFRQQLWNNLKCPNSTIGKIENIDYNQNELINFFIEYNECNNQEFVNYEKKQKRDLFNLTIRPGINTSSLSIENGITHVNDAYFGKEQTFRFGIEAEFIMPFYNNKWAILIEPTYQYFKSKKEITAYFVTQNVKADYTSIEIPIGVRHYFFLNENSKIFINGSFIFDFSGKSVIDYDNSNDLIIKSANNLAIGLGYNHNDRYSLELRYHTNRNVLSKYAYWASEYNTFSVIFGYSLF